jgi:hypothetical protein
MSIPVAAQSKGSFTLQAEPSRAEPNRTEPNRFGLENKPTLWNGSIHTARRTVPNRTEPDRAWPSVFTGGCLFLLAGRRPILLRSRSKFLGLIACFFFTMSANTLYCEVLINAVHLRAALWDQSYKNYQNRDLKLKYCGKKWLLNVTLLVSKNVIFLFIDCNSIK